MSNLAEAVKKVVEVLATFSSDERLRIVKASLTLLDDDFNPSNARASESGNPEHNRDHGASENSTLHSSLARQWMRKNGVTDDHLEHFFHFDQGEVIPIALPGSATSKREQTVNAYLTVGLASYLVDGNASFSDADGRKFCQQSGCYDGPNHTKAIKAAGNRLTGSKSAGWKLTAPGLTAVADLVKGS